MKKNIHAITILLYIFAETAFGISPSVNSDSLAYSILCEKLSADSTLPEHFPAYRLAADELAREGLFAEAFELLAELADTADEYGSGPVTFTESHVSETPLPSTSPPPDQITAPPRKEVQWRLSTGVQYDRFDDDYFNSSLGESVDDIGFSTVDSLEYATDQEPLGGNLRLSCQWRPDSLFINEFEPFIYLSEDRGRLGFEADGAFLRNLITLDLSFEGEKRWRQAFNDSSDALRGGGTIALTTAPSGRMFSFELPLSAEGEKFRKERSGYYSNVEISVNPALSFHSRDFSVNSALCWETEYERYLSINQEDNNIRSGPRLSVDLFHDRINTVLETSFFREHFFHATSPKKHNVLSVDGQFRFAPALWFEWIIDAAYVKEREYFTDQEEMVQSTVTDSIFDTTLTYSNHSWGIQIEPELRFNLPGSVTLFTRIGYERTAYPGVTATGEFRLIYPVTTFEPSQIMQPQLGIELNRKSFRMRLSISYRYEDVLRASYSADNDEIRPQMEWEWTILPWVILSAEGDYQYRWYRTGTVDDESTISASITTNVRF
jgi:hypothetical protein